MAAPPVTVHIETPRGGRTKRRSDGRIDFISPARCPFNYGYIPGTRAGDGAPVDALVLGDKLDAGALEMTYAYGWVAFEDAGQADPKLICGTHPPSDAERQRIERFFTLYALAKRALNGLRRLPGQTRYLGIHRLDAWEGAAPWDRPGIPDEA